MRTERPRKTKIGTEVAHVTRDSGTTFKVKGQLAWGRGILWRPPAQLVIVKTLLFVSSETVSCISAVQQDVNNYGKQVAFGALTWASGKVSWLVDTIL